MEINELVKSAWFRAILVDSCNWNNNRVKAFKEMYPKEYFYLHGFYRVRSELNRDVAIMQDAGVCQWFTLTFDNKRDKSLVSSKRKSATKFLNDLFIVYEMVEEYGEDNGRYHIHGFGVFREGKGFNDFRRWPCRCKIQALESAALKKKIKYLTKYAVKDLPRLRRSKNFVKLVKIATKYKGLKRNDFTRCYMCRINHAICRLEFNVL